jgi:hypothetical protein
MQDWLTRIEHGWTAFVAALGAGAAGGVLWLVRTIFTNRRELDMLRSEIVARTQQSATTHAAVLSAVKRVEERVTKIEGAVTYLERREMDRNKGEKE